MPSTFKYTVLNSFIWKFAECCGAGGIQLIIGIVLARLLLPEDYAIVIIAMVFVNLAKIFVDSGFSSALIQKKDIDENDTSTVFFISLLIAVGLYLILFISAPLIADVYIEPLLIPVLRIMGLILIIGVISSIQKVFISRNFHFKKLFFVSLIAGLISGVVGIYLAFSGYGVWALVWQQIASSIITAIILQILVKWVPKCLFSLDHAKSLFSFGWKILVAGIFYKICDSIRNLTIGVFYTKDALAYYNKGWEYPEYLSSALDGTVSSVLFPAYSRFQDDNETLKMMLRKAMSANAFITFPAMFGLASIAESFVLLLLTEKWMPCVIFFQIFCIYFSLQPISSANLAAIKAVGRSDILLRLEIIKNVIAYICLFATLPFGVVPIAIGMVLMKICAIIINVYPNKRLLNYSFIELIKDIVPFILLSGVMAGIIYCVSFIGLSPILTICIQIPLGILIYFGLAKLLHLKALDFIEETIKGYINSLLSRKKKHPNE